MTTTLGQTTPTTLAEAERAVRTLLRWCGEDPDRDGLADTPNRVARMLSEVTSGADADPAAVLSRTFDPGTRTDEMIIVPGIAVRSTCEHHLMPFLGTAAVAYLPKPGARVVGLSKLPRLVSLLARRLQVQERLTAQVTEAMDAHLDTLGSACVINARHGCMSARGVCDAGVSMVTSSLTGVFRDDARARSEFFNLAGVNQHGT